MYAVRVAPAQTFSFSSISQAASNAVSGAVSRGRNVAGIVASIFASIISLPQRAYNAVQQQAGKVVGYAVIPATTLFSKAKIKDEHNGIVKEFNSPFRSGLQTIEVSITIDEKVKLNGVSIEKKGPSNPQNDRWIVYCQPNAACWERMLPVLDNLHASTGANILSYNYRGVGFSEGMHTKDEELISDAIKVVQSLTAKGVKLENIELHGLSLGGTVATIAATKLALKVLGNERSLSSIQDVCATIFPVVGRIIGLIAGWAGWKLNAKACIPSLPENTCVIYHPTDDVIRYPASFVKACREANKSVHVIEMDPSHQGHVRSFNHREMVTYSKWARAALGLDR